MNFRRIQWIFVIAFTIFDVVLACYFAVGTHFTTLGKQQTQQQLVIKEMQNDDISFQSLATKQQTGYYVASNRSNDVLNRKSAALDNQSVRVNNGFLSSELLKPFKISALTPQQQLDQFVKNDHNVINGRRYVYNAKLSTSKTIVYTQKMEDRDVLGNEGQIRFKVNGKHRVYAYTQTYLTKIHVLRPRMNTISQQAAVIWLYKHNYIPNNSKINWASLGYTRAAITKDQAIYVPTWVVEIKTKSSDSTQQLRVNAFDSTLIHDTIQEIDTTSIKN